MKRFCTFVLLFSIISMPSWAKVSSWGIADQLRVRLISTVDSIGDQEEFLAGLDIELSEGWHTYWRVSGDTGLPPNLDWSASKNVKRVEVFWPTPKRKNEQGFYTFGYDKRVLLPLEITLANKAKPATLDLKSQIMVCKDICIPQAVSVSLEIPAGGGESSTLAMSIQKAKEKIPQEQGEPPFEEVQNLRIHSIVASSEALGIAITSMNGFDGVDVIPVIEEDGVVLSAPYELSASASGNNEARLRVPVNGQYDNLMQSLKGKTLTVTLTKGKEAVVKTIKY